MIRATGEPTGLLAERATYPLLALAGRPSPDALEQAIVDASAVLHRAGVAGVHVVEGGDVLAAFQRLRARGALSLRVCMMLPEDALDAAITLGVRSGFGDATLRLGGVKIFSDGALGSQTASMLEPYEGQPDNRGVVVRTREQLHALVGRAAAAGIASVVHAIGDRANRWVLDAIEAAREDSARFGLRHRIEHVQVLHPDDLPRLARLGVVASMQPIHCTQDRDIVDRYWGARGRYAYAFRSLLACGTRLTFGSDAPVETPDVLAGIHAAVARRRPNEPDRPAWHPEERLTVGEAVRAYTEGPGVRGGGGAREGEAAGRVRRGLRRAVGRPVHGGARRAGGRAGRPDRGRRGDALLGLVRRRRLFVRVVLVVLSERRDVERLRLLEVVVLALDAASPPGSRTRDIRRRRSRRRRPP